MRPDAAPDRTTTALDADTIEYVAASLFFFTIGRKPRCVHGALCLLHDPESLCIWRAVSPRLRAVYRAGVLDLLRKPERQEGEAQP
jgi:hypothetical protein